MSRPTSPRAPLRPGIALPIALASIIAVGALIAGVFFASTQEYRVGRNTMAASNALHAAEVGLSTVVSSWTPERTVKLKIGFRDTLPDTTIDHGYVKREWARVSPSMFWVTSTAIAGSQSLQGRALKRLNTLVRIDIPDLRIKGAITARGNVSASGNGAISGNDTTPPGWADCGAPSAPGAGLVVGDSAKNAGSSGNCAGFTCVSGTPKIADSSIYADSSTYKNFGGFNYDSLTKLVAADKIYTTGNSNKGTIDGRQPTFNADGSCNRADPANWGDTSHVNGPTGCRDYYPVVWLKGQNANWTVANYGGQGILLIDGNVTFDGKFTWYGPVLVLGTVSFGGTQQPRIIGGILAMNRNNGTHSIAGNAIVRFSRCTIQAVTARYSTARQTRYRPWADMSF